MTVSKTARRKPTKPTPPTKPRTKPTPPTPATIEVRARELHAALTADMAATRARLDGLANQLHVIDVLLEQPA